LKGLQLKGLQLKKLARSTQLEPRSARHSRLPDIQGFASAKITVTEHSVSKEETTLRYETRNWNRMYHWRKVPEFAFKLALARTKKHPNTQERELNNELNFWNEGLKNLEIFW
jgi:hypothetical protein